MTDGLAYLPERDMALDHDHCFLCGIELSAENRTDEHVFPQWLLNDFGLHNERINLLNGTTLPYRSLVIPCCTQCNNFWLSQIEDKVAPAIREGFDAVEGLDPLTLYLWMAKIYYGILFKELGLDLDRRDPTAGPIMDAESLRYAEDLHRVLQRARDRVEYSQLPGSLFLFRAQKPSPLSQQFDYRDVLNAPCLALRAGGVVITVHLLDWGAMAALDIEEFALARQLELHPIQFSEVAAMTAYVASLFDATPNYLIASDGERDHVLATLGGFSGQPLFREFEPEQYARVLADFAGVDLSKVWNGSGVWTWLRTSDRRPNYIPVEEDPEPTAKLT